MKKLLIILGLLVISGAAVAVAMSEKTDGNKQYGWHYKMTVEVETPEGVKTGSAVRGMGNSLVGSSLSQTGNPADIRGEAVVVDLGELGVLFVLIDHNSDQEFYATFPAPNGGGSTPEGIQYYASLPAGMKDELGTDRYLRLVTFTDMDDPKSVTLVYDRASCARVKNIQEECQQYTDKIGTYTVTNRFEELFGEGVKLKQITLETTDEPVTWGAVDEYLPWLNEFYNKRLDGKRYGTIKAKNKTANALSAGAFSTGEKK